MQPEVEATAAFPTNEPDLATMELFCKAVKIQGKNWLLQACEKA